MTNVGIRIKGCFTDSSGLSQASREVVSALYKAGVPVQIDPINIPTDPPFNPSSVDQEMGAILSEASRTSLDSMDCINVLMRQPPHYTHVCETALANIIFTMFETDSIPWLWTEIVKQGPVDEVWVPSTFNVDTFSNGGIPREKLYTVPLGVNLKTYNPDVEPMHLKKRPQFVFLSVMDLKESKGYDILLRSFCKNFNNRSDVVLLLKTYVPKYYHAQGQKELVERHEKRIKYIKEQCNSNARVWLMANDYSKEEMARLYRAADCYVIPTKGEGWNLPVLQSMASGVPVIVTNATAHMDFCNEKNSLLIRSTKKKIDDVRWLLREPLQSGHSWWEPDEQHLGELMLRAVEDGDLLKRLGRQALLDASKFTWERSARCIIDNMLRIEKKFLGEGQ